MIHLHVKVTEEQAAALRLRQQAVGVTVSEQVRRAIADALERDRFLADIAASKPQREAAIRKLLQTNVQPPALYKSIIGVAHLQVIDGLVIKKHQMLMILSFVRGNIGVSQIRTYLV